MSEEYDKMKNRKDEILAKRNSALSNETLYLNKLLIAIKALEELRSYEYIDTPQSDFIDNTLWEIQNYTGEQPSPGEETQTQKDER